MTRALLALVLLALASPALGTSANPESVRVVEPPELSAARGFSRTGGVNAITVFVGGSNADIDTAEESIWTTGGAYTFITAADELRIKASGSPADIYSGNGAREVVVEGLDASWNRISEVIQTKGAAASAKTSQKFIRLNRAYVRLAGTYTASNTAAITIETEAGTTLGVIPTEAGTTEMTQAIYSVPNGYAAYITGYAFTNSVTAGTVQKLWVRPRADNTTAPVPGQRLLSTDVTAAKTGSWYYNYDAPIYVPPKSDVWAAASGSANDYATAYFEIYLVPDVPAPTPSPIPSPTPTP